MYKGHEAIYRKLVPGNLSGDDYNLPTFSNVFSVEAFTNIS